MTLDELNAHICGAYELKEWHANGSVLGPPQVEGRFIVTSGTVSTILHNRSQPDKEITAVLLGEYEFDGATFAYRYRDSSIFTETAAGLVVSREPLWDGLRRFTASAVPSGVQLTSQDEQQGFLFTPAGLTYREGGRPLRVWSRMGAGRAPRS